VSRAFALAGVAVAVIAASPSATAAPTTSFPIRLGVGIGPINLGMTEAQVRRALGRPEGVLERTRVRGQPYVEFGWNYGAWNVGFVGRKGKRRVVVVGTGLTRHRTPAGVGVGTAERRLKRSIRGLRERNCSNPHGLGTTHWYLHRGSTETVFVVGYERDRSGDVRRTVRSVEVRGGPAVGCVLP
jgi:hypothetical protein